MRVIKKRKNAGGKKAIGRLKLIFGLILHFGIILNEICTKPFVGIALLILKSRSYIINV